MPSNSQKPSAWAGLVVAVSVTVTIFAFQYRLRETLGDVVVFSPFLLAPVVAAWYGGLWSGFVATALSAFLATFYFVPPLGSLAIYSAGDAIGIFLILIIGTATSLVSNLLHMARRELVEEQKRLRISEEFHQAIADLTSDFAFAYRLESRGPVVEAVSAGFTRLFGYTARELAVAGGPEAVVFGKGGREPEATRRLHAGEPVEEEFRYVGRDGRVRWLRFHTRPVRDATSGTLRLITAGSDITQRKQAEVATRATEERFRVLAETVPSMIWMADADGTISYANEQWMRFCGVDRDAGRGWPPLVVHPDDRQRCLDRWTRAVHDGTEYEVEVRHQRHDGTWRWFVTRARPLRDADDQIVCWFGVTTDIHEQKELQERLRLADRQKDEFLATLAHELRNPLAPIASSLEIMELSAHDPAHQEIARAVIRRQLRHLVRLVDDLLDVNRITRGKLELRRERVAIDDVLRDAIETTRPLLDTQRHQLVVSMPDERLMVDGDPPRLSQVCANLLNNAAKFTDRGGRIALEVWRESSHVAIGVRDSGVGIPADVLPRIFDAFAQGDTSLEGSRGGLGIGLTLVRRLVEAHGGTISAVSEGPGKGSEFVVRLPLAQTTADTPVLAADLPIAASPRRILVVDDNEDAVTSLGTLLRLTAHDVRTARDGEEALRLAATDRPDVVLLDIGIPKLNGYAVAERIREQPWGRTMALIALTGWGQPVDRERSRRAGFDHHLTKPVDHAYLARLLAEMPATTAPVSAPPTFRPSAEA